MMRLKLFVIVVPLIVLIGCASAPSASTPLPEEIDASDPLAATMLMQQGSVLVDEGRVDEAVRKYRMARELAPENPTVHNLLGLAELKRNDPAAAVAAFTRALALAPTYSDARNNRATAYVALGQYAAAEADYLHVLSDRMYANRAGVFFNLGSLNLARGNLASAEENLSKAAVPAGPIEAYLLLGRVQARLQRPAEAEATWREGMERAPERPEFPLELAILLEEQNRKDESRPLLQRVVSLAPSSPEATEARIRLGM